MIQHPFRTAPEKVWKVWPVFHPFRTKLYSSLEEAKRKHWLYDVVLHLLPRLILLTMFMLLLCGITASCIKFCCQKKRPPVQPFPRHPYDLTGVAIDSDSTAHSTVTCKYPWDSATQLCFVVEQVSRVLCSVLATTGTFWALLRTSSKSTGRAWENWVSSGPRSKWMQMASRI